MFPCILIHNICQQMHGTSDLFVLMESLVMEWRYEIQNYPLIVLMW